MGAWTAKGLHEAGERGETMAMGTQTSNRIEPEMLEKMARVARGFPGRVVSLDTDEQGDRSRADRVMRVDGVALAEILDRYERG